MCFNGFAYYLKPEKRSSDWEECCNRGSKSLGKLWGLVKEYPGKCKKGLAVG